MANYTIGDMIFETRVARGYSQEKLAFGICSTSSMSRIETGQQVPGKRVFDALMQRLGVSNSIYSAFISKEEMELYRLTQQLVWRLERLDFEESVRLANELESKIKEKDILEKQYLLFAKAQILLNEKKNNEEKALELLLSAIHITIPDFEIEKGAKRRLLTFNEITIINGIASIKISNGDEKAGLKLLFQLKEYMEEHKIDEEEKAKKYPMILYNITKSLGNIGLHQEVYNLCGEAIAFSVKHNKLSILCFLLTNKACAAAELEKCDEAEELFKQAVMLFQICENREFAERIAKEASSKYGVQID